MQSLSILSFKEMQTVLSWDVKSEHSIVMFGQFPSTVGLRASLIGASSRLPQTVPIYQVHHFE